MVDAAGGPLNDLTATAPILIAEVLSPSSVMSDLGDKAAEYLRLPACLHTSCSRKMKPRPGFGSRGETGFSPGPDVVAPSNGMIAIAALGIELPLSEIYTDLEAR